MGCDEYYTPVHPDAEEPFTSLDDYKQILIEETEFDEEDADYFIETQDVELRSVNGSEVVQIQEVCS
ncbi:hypothetical protein OB919_20815 [Halobacteria archaeon AArc-curdl1]|uniref:Uncharacterized protein n=1 Tax=Natronosalvus hydrolyticus TaxID=2979988 RepID=A0AAP2ZC61_9EURY|nr:hypothetical protein [Halobacteria archaeon AArc-curdl1]